MMQVSPTHRLLSWQSPLFWTVFLAASLIAAIAAIKLMFVAAPGLSVDIQFSRDQAVSSARQFQQHQFPDLKTERSAVIFVSDRGLQNYVELEAGGADKVQELIPQLDAVTHYWKVRSFAPGQEEELITAFSPRGEPISFAYLIAEKTPGAALDETAARALAEEGARAFMGERFDLYKTFETKQKRQASGRVDYSFTYEHSTLMVGEARFRLELKVAGDRLVAVDTFKHIPQAFDQRFGEMRALNTQISQISAYIMAVLFGLGGLVGGGIWLFRRHQLQWVKAFWPALVVGAGLGAATLANMPMAWMGYQTTSSAQTFLFQQLAQAGGVIFVASLAFATIYAVAEGLTRMAFADHPRLWDMFRKETLSPDILGRVLGGFAWTGFFLLYAMVFYWFSTKVLGWWQPTGMDSDPNILASWRPALAPIFTALQAGTWEECLFRAIPLALAVLIGNHYGIRNKLVIVTLIVQALVFAGVHANYPNLPGYSRLIELFIPAIVFGLVYLRFGLAICMITHFEYDLVLMSLPIFIAEDSSLWIDRALVIGAGIAPLAALLWAKVRGGQWQALGSEWRNGVPVAVVPVNVEEVAPEPQAAGSALVIKPLWIGLIAVVAIGLFAANLTKTPRLDWPAYEIHRAQAQEKAEAYLAERGVKLEGEWHRTATTYGGWSQPLEFVWRESGKEKTQGLIGQYLDTPFWVITWRKFDGPVEERSEQWQAWLYPDGRLHELVHQLPEGRAGAKLSREQAVSKAMEWIIQKGWGDLSSLEEKSVEETLRPARSDWVVTYLDKGAYDHEGARAAIIIKLAGDEVTSYVRTIDIPEEWKRTESEESSRQQPYNIVSKVALLVLIGMALICFFRRAAGSKFSFMAALPWILVVSIANMSVTLLWSDPAFASFQTTMGWWMQVGMLLFGVGIATSVLAVLVFLVAQVIHGERPRVGANLNSDFILGSLLALGLMGCKSLIDLVVPASWTPTPYSADWATVMPWLTAILNGFKGVFPKLLLIIVAVGFARYLTKTWRWALVMATVLVWLLCSSMASRTFINTFAEQLFTAATVWLAFILIRRQQMGVVLALMGGLIALQQLWVTTAIYPGALWHGLLSCAVCVGLSYVLLRHWYRRGLE
ncbi:CPBP family intramembrane glutamic endopeptidase [Cellvibrio sp. pealriver]|uniref:CPBP family intramembrane glutamic endopeptidase n=1 Tax=Cellvibrio sp. pealriver TaxID=1622269 RepID=UPI00066FC830|nr:CPBP family intramembrane glutamic endopeptidase [Cellvibrio sp. pealriver]